MTIDENILMPSLSKISGFAYLLNGNRIVESIREEYSGVVPIDEDYTVLETTHKIAIVFSRWIVFRPRVLVLLEPFLQCGAAGESAVASYIHRLSMLGTIVIIVQSRERDSGIEESVTYFID